VAQSDSRPSIFDRSVSTVIRLHSNTRVPGLCANERANESLGTTSSGIGSVLERNVNVRVHSFRARSVLWWPDPSYIRRTQRMIHITPLPKCKTGIVFPDKHYIRSSNCDCPGSLHMSCKGIDCPLVDERVRCCSPLGVADQARCTELDSMLVSMVISFTE
jgi:hypothetical protein